jgi:hypothetical protein
MTKKYSYLKKKLGTKISKMSKHAISYTCFKGKVISAIQCRKLNHHPPLVPCLWPFYYRVLPRTRTIDSDNWGQTTFFPGAAQKPPIQPIIIAGGSGTRLWPMSRKLYPKQYLALTGEMSMLQETLKRLEGLEARQPVLVCNEAQRFVAAEQMRRMGLEDPICSRPAKRPWKMVLRTQNVW